MNASKNNILNRIRKALEKPVPLPFPQSAKAEDFYPLPQDDVTVIFAEQFTSLQGKFQFCMNEQEVVQQFAHIAALQNWAHIYCAEPTIREMFIRNGFDHFTERALADADVVITTCEFLVARTGSMVLSSAKVEGRTASVYAPVHVCIASTDQVVYDIGDALDLMKQKYGLRLPSMISFATGPSRTADIEKTLVVGVHGPKEVYCFLADQLPQ
ncbi:MAG: lactate utilization protein C [Sphingobacteriales bacterium]|jgi:L-lactate dehydrogenase complex protein LldG